MKKFSNGTRVQMISSQGSARTGMIGTIIKDNTPLPHNLVDFDDMTTGHDGHANYSGKVRSRYYVNRENLVEVVVATMPTAPANPQTKIDKLKAHFLSGKSLTQLEAIGLYGAYRLAARVHDLKKQGWKFTTVIKEDPNGSPYAEYRLRTEARA